MIINCNYCKSKLKLKYHVSVNGKDYYRDCKKCRNLTYKRFPSYIPIKQYEKYVSKLNEI